MTFLKNIGSMFGRQIFVQLLPLLTFPLIVRVLGPELYGKWVYVQTTVGFFALLANPGLTVYGLRQIAAERNRTADLVPLLVSVMMAFGILSYLLLCILTAVSSRDTVNTQLMLLYGLVLIVNGLFSLEWVFNGMQRFDWSALFSIISNVFFTAGVFLFLRSQDLVWVLPLVSILGTLFAGLMGWRWLGRSGVRFRFVSDVRQGALVLGTSLFYFFSSLMVMIYNKADHLLLSWLKGDNALGQYGASYKLMGAVMGMVLVVVTVFVPYAASASAQSPEEFRLLLRKGLLIVSAVSLPMAAGGCVLAHDLVTLVMGPSFLHAGDIFRLLAWNIPCGALASFFAGTLLYASGHHRRYAIVTVPAAFVNILLNLILIPLLGAIGAALTTILAQLVVIVSACYLGRRYLKNVFGRSLFYPVLATLIMAGALLLLAQFAMPVLLRVGAGMAVYVLSLFVIDWAGGRELISLITSPRGVQPDSSNGTL